MCDEHSMMRRRLHALQRTPLRAAHACATAGCVLNSSSSWAARALRPASRTDCATAYGRDMAERGHQVSVTPHSLLNRRTLS